VGVGDRDALVGVAVVVDDLLFHVADDDDEFVRTEVDQLIEAVGDERFAVDLDHPFGLVFRERAEARALAGCEYDCFHDPSVQFSQS